MEQRSALVVVLALAACGRLGAAVYCVAPGGSDSAAGSVAAPFQTLAKAAAVAMPGDTVQLRQGVYRETLTAVRSGTAAAPIVFEGYPGEDAVLAGSNLVAGPWTLYSGKIWQCDGLPATRAVYVDGVHMPEARWPNVAPGAAMTAGWATADTGSNSTTLVDAALPAGSLNGARVRIIPGAAWVAYSRTVQSYGGGQFTFDASVGPNTSYWPKAGNLYYLYRSLALLDSAGEWYQDPSSHRLYLWLPDGGSPTAHQVEIASRKAVAGVQGYSYIQLRDLFTFSGWIDFNGSSGSKVINVDQRYVHENWDVDGYNYEPTLNEMAGGSGGEWGGGSIDGSTGDGLYISGSGHRVHDMVIHDVDWIATYRGAVRMGGSNHSIDHNSFYDSARFLIFHDQAKGGSLDHNELYNAGLLTMDLGATYCYRCNGGGMVIAYNHVHDVHCSVGAGIYLDNGGSNFRIHHNLVHNVDWFALKLNLPSYDNLVVNNTLFATKYWVNAAGSQYPQEMTGTALVNNLYSGGSSLVSGAMGPSLVTNGSYTAPPAVFATGAWTLAAGSPAIDKGTVKAPYTDGYCGSKPDQGCFEYGCGANWSAGSGQTPPLFPYPFPDPGSPTRTPTRTATRTPTRTATRTPTRTVTRTPSPIASATPSASRTGSPTPSPSRTASAMASPTRSASPSGTPTPTRSSTSTASPSVTGTPTRSPTSTASPSVTETPTPSSTSTASPSVTGTPTRSSTSTASPSVTGTPTPSSTSTASPSVTGTPTRSSTLTASPSETPTPTRSSTLTASPSGTPTPTRSSTLTASPTVTETPTRSSTLTASPTVTETPTVTLTASPRASASPSFTASPSLSPSPSATVAAGPLSLDRAVPLPDPIRGGHLRLRYHSGAAAAEIELRLYSAAEVLVGQRRLPGPSAPGWNQAETDWPDLAPGFYYLRLRLRDGGRQSEAYGLKLFDLP